MKITFWRKWHRWIGFPAALFLLFASITGFLVAGTEFFGADEAAREATRRMVSPVTAGAPSTSWSEPIARALAAVNARAPGARVDFVTVQFKGAPPAVIVVTAAPPGGEDKKYVIDARTGAVISVEAYADKPFLYRLHSGEAFGDGGLVVAMLWALALAVLTVTGLIIYLKLRRDNLTGWRRVFW
ncbi:MAG: PepSY-associated TM helix domain-containing protein [Gemmatimonadaceae bacterium]